MRVNNITYLSRVALSIVCVCLCVYVSVRLVLRSEEEEGVAISPELRERYLRFDVSYREEQARALVNVSLFELVERLERRSSDRSLHNADLFPPLQVDTPTVVVLAHRDAERLQYLIVSLAQVRDIHSVLLVFSHGFYDERIDELVEAIDFCLVKQIYYPNSVQLYPTSFPGTDVDDCTNDATANGSRYCAIRDGRRCEGKHHWWWTAHVVFEQRWPWFESHRGMVTFIGEDSYVLPDLVHMMSLADRAVLDVPEVEVISFGRPRANGLDYDKFTVGIWKPLYENGFTLNVSTWAKISAESIWFCEYDDTSWSYSLLAVFGRWPRGWALTVASVAPRVISTGAYPSGRAAWAALGPQLRAARSHMFPRDVHALLLYDTEGMRFEYFKLPPRGNGGWSDYRDLNLCHEPLTDNDTDYDSTATTPYLDTIKAISRM